MLCFIKNRRVGALFTALNECIFLMLLCMQLKSTHPFPSSSGNFEGGGSYLMSADCQHCFGAC